MEEWELQAEADCFPQAGSEYILRPENRIQPILKQSKGGHEYMELKVCMHIYNSEPPYNSLTPFHVLRVNLYPDQLREFTGDRWNDSRVYRVKCQQDGRKRYLHIMETFPYTQGPISPAPAGGQVAGQPAPPAGETCACDPRNRVCVQVGKQTVCGGPQGCGRVVA